MQDFENEQKFEFLITQEKQQKPSQNSQQMLSFNLSITAKNSSIKNTPILTKISDFTEKTQSKQNVIEDADDFFDNFEKYYKIQGLTPIKYKEQIDSPLKLLLPSVESSHEQSQLDLKQTNEICLEKLKETTFSKKIFRNHLYQQRDNKTRIHNLIKDKHIKQIINYQNTHEIIKINNFSPMLIGSKTRMIQRKNTPYGNLCRKSKTICNTRKNNSLISIKKTCNPNPSIFQDKSKTNELFKPIHSWRGIQNLNPNQSNGFNKVKQFQIHKKNRMFKKRQSDTQKQQFGRLSANFATMRL